MTNKEYQKKEKITRDIKEKCKNVTFRRVHCCRWLETSIATDGLNNAFNREV